MSYRVTMKDGRIFRAARVEASFGFVTLFCWDGEKRYPAAEVAEICSTALEDGIAFTGLLVFIFIVAFILAMVFLPTS
ncbi:MAG TPA: hypothetical protein PLB10_03275 [Thiolinea sp.]|nr:hypothetical protein [Thiolinea sp.]